MKSLCIDLTDPAWWSVIATIIAALTAALITWILGRRQNELQKQQIKLQEQQNVIQQRQLQLEKFNIQREIYRNLYLLSLDSRVVLPLVYEYFVTGSTELLLSRFDKYNVDFERLARKIEINEADYLLQFGKNEMIVDARCFADGVSFIFSKVASIHIEPRKDTISIFERLFARKNNWNDLEWIENIKKKWPDDNLIEMLEFFVKEKQRLFEGKNSVLYLVKENIKD